MDIISSHYGEQIQSTLDDMKKEWSAPFFDYYSNNINPDINGIARWAIELHGIYNPLSGITNNQSESLNFVIKQLHLIAWHFPYAIGRATM